MQGTYLSKLGRLFQVPLEAMESGIVVFEVCTRGLAAAAPQIAGHDLVEECCCCCPRTVEACVDADAGPTVGQAGIRGWDDRVRRFVLMV